MIELLPESGKLYKVNMHCHTNISDGTRPPEEVKEFYKKNGYSAVCFTDHEVLIDHRDLCDDEFIALHGYEVAIKKDLNTKTGYFMPVYHFNLFAKEQDNLKMPMFFKNNPSYPGNAREWMKTHGKYDETIDTYEYSFDWINNYTKTLTESGFLVSYNHPQWSLHNHSDFAGLKYIHSFELINGGCAPLCDNTSIHYHQMLQSGARIVPNGGDDNHSEDGSLLAWTMIKADELSYSALMQAYERGDCYASEGPDILRLVIDNGKIIVKTSPAAGIYLRCESRYADFVQSRTETFTEAEFDYCPEKIGSFFRIEVKDSAGCKAFSNAYYTADIKFKSLCHTSHK